jgi:hypothetical protein
MRRASLRVYLQSNSDGSDKIIIGGGPLILQPLQQLRQLGEVGGEPPRLFKATHCHASIGSASGKGSPPTSV